MVGQIRVGRSKYLSGQVVYPNFPEFTNIPVLTLRQGRYGELGPYNLKNLQGQILENIWQMSKAYPIVHPVSIPYSSGNPTIVWKWPISATGQLLKQSEVHIDVHGNLTPEYWRWRMAGKNHQLPVRNPVGWNHMNEVKFSLLKDEPPSETNPKLDYISARKQIYVPIYMEAVVQHPLFLELWGRLQNHENLTIIDVDGPHQESMSYYQEKYGVPDNFIQEDTVLVNQDNLSVLLNDPKHPFGHGYVLAWTLQNYRLESISFSDLQNRLNGGFLSSAEVRPEFQHLVPTGHQLVKALGPEGRVYWIDCSP